MRVSRELRSFCLFFFFYSTVIVLFTSQLPSSPYTLQAFLNVRNGNWELGEEARDRNGLLS